MNRRKACAAVMALAMLIGGAAAAQETMVLTDDLGRSVTIERQPQRVAALIGSFADIWCLAGGADSLAAAADDTFRKFDLPIAADTINLGATKDISLEKLLLAQPQLVIASCSTAEQVALKPALSQMGLNTVYFDVDSFEDYLRMLRVCTQITGCDDNYARYGEDVQAQVDAARSRADGSRPTVLYIRATGTSCRVKGSEGSVLGEMLAAMDCRNIADIGTRASNSSAWSISSLPTRSTSSSCCRAPTPPTRSRSWRPRC